MEIDFAKIVKAALEAGLNGWPLAVVIVAVVFVTQIPSIIKALGEVFQRRKETHLEHQRLCREFEANQEYRRELHGIGSPTASVLPHEAMKQITHEVAKSPSQPNMGGTPRRKRAQPSNG